MLVGPFVGSEKAKQRFKIKQQNNSKPRKCVEKPEWTELLTLTAVCSWMFACLADELPDNTTPAAAPSPSVCSSWSSNRRGSGDFWVHTARRRLGSSRSSANSQHWRDGAPQRGITQPISVAILDTILLPEPPGLSSVFNIPQQCLLSL